MTVGPVSLPHPGTIDSLSSPDLAIIATDSIPGYGVPPMEPVNEVGFYFEVLHANGSREQIGPALSGELSFDTNREVCKALGGFVLIPEEARKVDFSTDQIIAWLDYDGVRYPLGIFCFTEVSEQKDVVLYVDDDDNEVISDIFNISLGDRTVLLMRNDGAARSLLTGFDPAQEMKRIMDVARIPNSVPGSNGASATSITWDGSVTDLSKVRGLATLAGFRFPWMTNAGVVQAISAGLTLINFDILDVEKLFPTQGSIVITPKYLGAPNRVIVSDNSFPEFALRGQWDAPSAAPHSYANLGYYRTEVVEEQGLGSGENANSVAKRIGENFTARTLDFQCMPTYLLDGPIVLSYKEAFWIVQSWSLSTDPGATMSVNAIELIVEG